MKAPKEIRVKHGLLFDILITLLVFGSIGTGLFFTLKPKDIKTAQVEYKVTFETLEKDIASKISLDDEFLSSEGESMGIVTSVLNDNKTFLTIDQTSSQGEYVTNFSSEFNTVKATISATAVYENGCYFIGGQPLRAGEQLVMRLPDFYGVATVTAVSIMN